MLVWFMSSLLASSALSSQQRTLPDRNSIAGQVVKVGSGEPIAKATVTITRADAASGESYTTTTSNEGQFVFQNIQPGRYRLSATRNGYVRAEYGTRSPNGPGSPITVAGNQNLTGIELRMIPGGTITGRVLDREGEPVANAVVEALKYSYRDGQRVMTVTQTVRSNDLGEYRLFWLQPGRYFVSATAPPPDARDQSAEAYIPIYYPGTADELAAAPIDLRGGIVLGGVDLAVMPARTLVVQGQIINGVTGQPSSNATIMVSRARHQANGSGFRISMRNLANIGTRMTNQGAFEIRGLVPGDYEIHGVLNERNLHLTARVPIEIGNTDVRNVAVVVQPGFKLTGRVAIEGQQAGQNNPELANVLVTLDLDSRNPLGEVPLVSPLRADGTFQLDHVGRDDYRISLAGMPANAYVKSARLGSVDVMTDGLRLEQPPANVLEILLSRNSVTVEGSVQNEKNEPAANVTVVLTPENSLRNRRDLYRTASTDASGRYRIEGVPPGDYRAYAWEDVEAGAWQDPEFLRQFEDRSRTVRVNEGGTSAVELRLIPAQ